MPREKIHIENFNLGIMSEPDPRDIPLGAFATSSNTDPNSYGILRGVLSAGTNYKLYSNVEMSEWIVRDDGTRDLVYSDGANIRSVLDFYGTTAAGNTISGRGYSFIPQNKKIYIGMGTSANPKVALRIPAAKFNGIIARTVGSGTDDLVIDSTEYDGTATTYYIKITNTAGATGTFSSVSLFDNPAYPFAVFNSTHGLSPDNNGDEITLSTGAGAGTYNGTYKFYYLTATSFVLYDPDKLGYVFYSATDSGSWALTAAEGSTGWKWSTDDATYYPTTALSTKEFANVGTNGLKARFITETGKALNDKWTVTFSSANSETLYIEDAECYNYQNNESTDNPFIQLQVSAGTPSSEGFFTEGRKYFYGWSIIYDNTEESPIAYRSKGNNPTTFSTATPLGDLLIDFKFTTSSLPKRITGFNLWCAEASNNSAEKPETEFKYVLSLNLNGARVASTTYTFKLKDAGKRGMTYENQTGVSEVANSNSVRYTLSAQVNDKLFVGVCSRAGITNATNVLFRSKALRFGMFDWANELLPLPTKPTAMLAFRGRLLVFDESKLYIIDPETFSIIQEFNTGCPYSQGFAVTEDAIYWYDRNAFYKYDGIQPIDLSTKKIRTTYQALPSATSFNGIKCIYDATIKTVLIGYRDTADLKCLSYHVLNDRWDSFTLQATYIDTYWGLFAGKNGETYTSGEIAISRIFATSRRTWTATTGRINCGSPAIRKKFYIIRVLSSAAPTIQFKIDGGTTTAITGSEDVKVSGEWGEGYDIQVILTDSVGTKEVYSIDIYYRELGIR